MASETKRELASSGMTHNDGPCGIQTVFLCELREIAVSVANIFERTRPSSTFISHAAVFHIPGGEAFGGQRSAEVSCVSQVILGTPEPTMNVHNYGKRTLSFWKTYLSELVGISSVSEAGIRRRRG